MKSNSFLFIIYCSYYSSLQMRVANFFKTMDSDYSLKLSYREFKTGISDFILNYNAISSKS